jgi:DNA polymerase zeta
LQSQLLIYLFINSHLLFFILFLYRQFKTCRQQSRIDRRSEPRIGERVPYIIVYGSPGVPLIRLVVPANLLLIDTSLRLNAHYYITRAIIPALQRCLGLLGVDVLSW